MQDQTYDRLREMLGANADKGIDEKFQELMGKRAEPHFNFDEDEEEQLMLARHELEPKYVIVKHSTGYEFRARYTDMHRSMLSPDEIRQRRCDGGGFWGVDGETRRVTLYDSSSDFGRPKNIEAAIRQDGQNLLAILGRVCDKTGQEHDLSDYTITYIDAARVRHVVEPPYGQQSEIMDTEQMLSRYADAGISASVSVRRHSNVMPSQKGNQKKRKAKARQQKQSRKKNRR